MIRPNGVEKQVRPIWPSERPDITDFSVTYNTTAGTSSTHALCCSDDGKNLYMIDANWPIYQYELSDGTLNTLWSSSYSLSGVKSRWACIKSDWETLYSCLDGSPYSYTVQMSTPFEIDTGTTTTQSIPYNTAPCGCEFSSDWVYFYCVYWYGENELYQYTLSTPRDLTTATLTRSQNLSDYNSDGYLYDVRFSPTGLKMYVGNRPNNMGKIRQYNLSTAWDISTSTYFWAIDLSSYVYWTGNTFDFANNGKRIFVHAVADTRILQLDAS